ncbi:helicase/SNF2 family domain protein [Bacterioplanes sanyensis]|uniref:DEAD/DEAH box helicase n=1 Tax=Bacterioplanes sanyensis TaxID=1249553 RepID=UPI0016738CF8|nr:DEAD/DEAH box helicase [Bacterioplanes sanyensis]GGY55699.1 helicase/SNF2 family domain protein [Bacterioplanes sanyensis]
MPQFTRQHIEAMASAATFQRGERYFQQQRVKSFRPLSEDEVMADIEGTQRYQTLLRWYRGRLESVCSCPVQHNCKHAIALALTWLEQDVDPLLQGLPRELEQWLSKAPTERSSAPLASGRDHILYSFTQVHGQVRLEVYKGYLKKNGEWSRIKRYTPSHLSDYMHPEFLAPEDIDALRLLQATSRSQLILQTPNDYLALQILLPTGRLRYSNQPVVSGPSRTLDWHWQQQAQTYQLQAEVSGCDDFWLIATEPPYYLDLQNGQLGLLQSSFNPAQVRHLQQMPAMTAEQLQQAIIPMRRHYHRDQLSLPIDEPELNHCNTPEPCLTLTSHAWGDESYQPGARLTFIYAGQEFPSWQHTGSGQSWHSHEGEQWCIQRDYDREDELADELIHLGLFTFDGEVWLAQAHDLHAELAMWQQFIADSVPQLQQQGWHIRGLDDMNTTPIQVTPKVTLRDDDGHWFDFALSLPVGDELFLDTQQAIDIWLEQGQPEQLLVPTDDGLVQIDASPLQQLAQLITELHSSKQLNQINRLPAFQLSRMSDLPELDERQAPQAQKLRQQLQDFNGIEQHGPVQGLHATLRPYQQEGLDWLLFLRRYQFGGILADDMGLGKTLQTLALIQALKNRGELDKPALIVAPTSLMSNWQHEASRFTPELKVTLIHGPERDDAFGHIKDSDLVLTSYPLLVRDAARYRKRRFSLLILDEAQNIKNPLTKTAKQVRQLQCDTRLCLSGTPLENHLGELWALMDVALPGLLGGRKSFQQYYRTPIEKHSNSQRQQELAKLVAPFMLRRTKEEVVSELPAKTEIVQYVELGGQQRTLYESIRMSMQKRMQELIASQGMERSHIQFLDALLKLRQACISPALVKLDQAAKVKECAKFEWLQQQLPQLLEEGRNILIFSQFTQVLGLIESQLKQQQITYSKLTGQTRKRQQAIERFQSGDARVFLISLKAGGSGLNLTAADVVVHMDPWWNPAVENQATDRAHRIGQDKPVFVYKLVASDTVEERIQQMQRDKQALADQLFDHSNAAGLPQNSEQLLALLAP